MTAMLMGCWEAPANSASAPPVRVGYRARCVAHNFGGTLYGPDLIGKMKANESVDRHNATVTHVGVVDRPISR